MTVELISSALSPITIILLCGLPAAGKSSLARKLETAISSSSQINPDSQTPSRASSDPSTFDSSSLDSEIASPTSSSRQPIETYNVHIIEYDHIEDEQLEIMISAHSLELTQQQQQEEDSTEVKNDGEFIQSREAWKRTRSIAIQRLQEILDEREKMHCQHSNQNTEDSTQSSTSPKNRATSANKGRTVVLMDDNYHLRGMRKQIHRFLLHNKYSQPINFGIIWVDESLELCLKRNNQRRKKESILQNQHHDQKNMDGNEKIRQRPRRDIPDTVIQKMNDAFEPPRVAWESNYIITNMCCWMDDEEESSSGSQVIARKREINEKSEEASHHKSFSDVLSFVMNCPRIINLPDDESDPILKEELLKTAREATQNSHMHNLDQTVRKWVGLVAKLDKTLARSANDARKSVLQNHRPSSSSSSNKSSLSLVDIRKEFIDLVVRDRSGGADLEKSRILQIELETVLA